MASVKSKKYDLEERTFIFAKNVIEYVRYLPKGIAYSAIGRQLVRSSGSVGANVRNYRKSLVPLQKRSRKAGPFCKFQIPNSKHQIPNLSHNLFT